MYYIKDIHNLHIIFIIYIIQNSIFTYTITNNKHFAMHDN